MVATILFMISGVCLSALIANIRRDDKLFYILVVGLFLGAGMGKSKMFKSEKDKISQTVEVIQDVNDVKPTQLTHLFTLDELYALSGTVSKEISKTTFIPCQQVAPQENYPWRIFNFEDSS